MSDAETVYAAAQALIERARVKGSSKISFSGRQFRALTRLPPEIGNLGGLQILSLNLTGVTDLTPLSPLTGLRILDLNRTGVTDLSPLSPLTGLQTLSLTQTGVTDLSPLSPLTGLQSLSLAQTGVTDLAPLSPLTGLQTLRLAQTGVTDLSPLSPLTGLQTLSLTQTGVTDLAPLSPLTGLQSLYLAQTGVTDLAPLEPLTGLQRLSLTQTGVTDLAPLEPLTGLRDLLLDSNGVTDLRPLRDLDRLGTGLRYGLTFRNTPATAHDAELARLAGIDDPKERAAQTRAYLHTLPPWPEPLPWDIPSGSLPETPPAAPGPDAVPRVILSSDGRVDLDHSPATQDDLADPIKERLYARLPDAVGKLARYHNHPEISGPALALRDLVAAPFEDADMLDIHLQLGALTDVKEADARKREIERLDPDCMAALNGVLRLGPPVTMGHPDVDLLEKRSIEYARTRLAATVAESERQLADGLSRNETIATERARDTARQVARAGDDGRVAGYRRAFVRNVAIALGVLADAATGYVAGEVVVAAAQFLVMHKNAIMAIAPGWGETGYKWAEYLIMKADRILKDAGKTP